MSTPNANRNLPAGDTVSALLPGDPAPSGPVALLHRVLTSTRKAA